MFQQTAKELIAFIEKSPTCFQAVASMKETLEQEGYQELKENEKWQIEKGGNYFVTRNDSALIAFSVPQGEWKGFHIMASHSDSPSFKIKDNPEMTVENKYVKLNVEKYGGMICAPWFDRPLSVAGRVVVKENNAFVTKLVDIDRDLLMIPNLAIHMSRQINDGYQYSAQKDMLPLYGEIGAKDTFMEAVAQNVGVKAEDILGHDLFLYNRQKGSIWGAQEEFLSVGRLDDLQCAFASLKGFLGGEKKEHVAVHCVLDNEEVGSSTKQGAASTFLYDVLVRMTRSLGMDYEDYLRTLADSFMVSADNGHALHPNYTEKADPVNRPVLNQGIVIKYAGNQKYCTDAVSAAMFKDLCKQAEAPYQTFTNHSDVPGGSTLGNISNTKVALNSVDIGLPLLAMHSPYETAGVKDTYYLVEVAKKLFA